MDTFTFKGISSSDFENLVVVALPPITKPTLRVNEIEIDGRDGSLITDQGYETYEKTIEIVQMGDLDVEELKAWLDGEGELTLSNESDKYYHAKIIEQIDYTRLELYKPVKVEFLVQPYKYKLNETEVTSTTNSVTVTNYGACESKPLITIEGSGTITVTVNEKIVFTYSFPTTDGEVTIDSENEEAYLGNINNLKNRNMNGDFPKLQSGENTISVSGTVTSIKVKANSRWL